MMRFQQRDALYKFNKYTAAQVEDVQNKSKEN